MLADNCFLSRCANQEKHIPSHVQTSYSFSIRCTNMAASIKGWPILAELRGQLQLAHQNVIPAGPSPSSLVCNLYICRQLLVLFPFCNFCFFLVLLQPLHTAILRPAKVVFPPRPLSKDSLHPEMETRLETTAEVSTLEPHSVRVFPDTPVHGDLSTHAGIFSVPTLVVTGDMKQNNNNKKTRQAVLFAPACVGRSTWL